MNASINYTTKPAPSHVSPTSSYIILPPPTNRKKPHKPQHFIASGGAIAPPPAVPHQRPAIPPAHGASLRANVSTGDGGGNDGGPGSSRLLVSCVCRRGRECVVVGGGEGTGVWVWWGRGGGRGLFDLCAQHVSGNGRKEGRSCLAYHGSVAISNAANTHTHPQPPTNPTSSLSF